MRLLSICIPAYNRSKDLRLLLDSIIEHGAAHLERGEIEVVISDNASTDGTDELIRSYEGRLKRLIYRRNPTNVGFARNLRQSIDLSSADYCWLMGSDEKIVASAIDTIFFAVRQSPDLVIGNPITKGVERQFLKTRGTQTFHFASADDFQHYVENCQEISATFALISTIVVRKAFWLSAPSTEWEFLHPYTHMLQICRAISTGATHLLYVDTPLVETGYNVNEFNRTLLPHFELDLLTIEYVAMTIFQKQVSLFAAYGRIFRLQYTGMEVLKARVESSIERWTRLLPSLQYFGYPRHLLRKAFYDRIILFAYYFFKRLNALLHRV